MFDSFLAEKLEAYVYMLVDPRSGQPFYIGKGRGNRVFDHVTFALEEPKSSDKYERIREIVSEGYQVSHLILRHGLSDESAFEVESALIDFCTVLDQPMTNLVAGHGTSAFGAMTSDEIIRKYKAEPLSHLEPGFVLININKTYKRAKGQLSYYEATKELWVIAEDRIPTIKYALAEYKGVIVEVFKILDWYSKEAISRSGKIGMRWGFNGVVAEDEVRERYLNKAVNKPRGAANPIRYNYSSHVNEVIE